MPDAAHHCEAWPLADGRTLHTCSECGSWALDHPPTFPCEADLWQAGYEAGYRMGIAAVRPGAVQLRVQKEISERLAAKVMVLERAVQAVRDLAVRAVPGLSGPPKDCTNNCRTGDCDCSGNWVALAWSLDPAKVLAALGGEQ